MSHQQNTTRKHGRVCLFRDSPAVRFLPQLFRRRSLLYVKVRTLTQLSSFGLFLAKKLIVSKAPTYVINGLGIQYVSNLRVCIVGCVCVCVVVGGGGEVGSQRTERDYAKIQITV